MNRLRQTALFALHISLWASGLVGLSAMRVGAQAAVSLRIEVHSAEGPVAGARVTVAEVGALSDSAGAVLLRVPAGLHRLTVERIGYESVERELSIARDTTIRIELSEEAVEEEEIIVMSTRGERRVEDEPVRVEVLTREEIEEKMLMTPGSIAMLLNETAGLRVQETTPSLGGATIRIQGLRGRYTQLLADGLPLHGGQAGSLGLLQIPPVDLRQVEVIKGAASALYGASALGGVVNLISRRPARDREVLLNQTTRGGSDALLWLSDTLASRWSYTALVGVHLQSRTDVDGDEWSDIPYHQRITLRPRVFWTASDGSAVMLTVGGMAEERRGGGIAGDGEAHPLDLTTRRFDAGMTGRFPLRENLLMDVRASGFFASHDHRFGTRDESDRHTTSFAEASLRSSRGAHALAVGAAVQREVYTAQDVTGFDFAHWVPGLFVQDELTATPWLAVALSARVDHHEEFGTFLSPRASARFRAPSDWTLRLSAGSGFFAPTPFTEESEEIGLARVIRAVDWKAERARSFSADVGGVVAGVELAATLFASVIDDAVSVRPATQPGFAQLFNLSGETRTHGTELLLRYRREPWGLTASHTYIRATEPDPSGAGRRTVPLTPRHAAGLIGVYERHGEGRVGIEMYYTGRQFLDDNPFQNTSDAYTVVGLLIEKRFGRARAFVNFENVTDVRQTRYHPFIRPSPGPFGEWTTDAWAPLEGRVFNGGVRIAF